MHECTAWPPISDVLFMDAAEFPATMLNAIIAPRPIGWISSISSDGRANLAPFSYFNALSTSPPMLAFACNAPGDRAEKDTAANLRSVPEFVFNFVSVSLGAAMNLSSASLMTGDDEFEFAELQKAPSRIVRPPRVAIAPASLECKVLDIIDLDPDATGRTVTSLVVGRVLAAHVCRSYIDEDGRFATVRAEPLTRMGGAAYAEIGRVSTIPRPQLSTRN